MNKKNEIFYHENRNRSQHDSQGFSLFFGEKEKCFRLYHLPLLISLLNFCSCVNGERKPD